MSAGVQPEEEGRLLCLECGRWFIALGNHTARAHEGPAEYRRVHGLPASLGLLASEHKQAASERGRELVKDPRALERLRPKRPMSEVLAMAHEARRESKDRPGVRAISKAAAAKAAPKRSATARRRAEEKVAVAAADLGYGSNAELVAATRDLSDIAFAALTGLTHDRAIRFRRLHGVQSEKRLVPPSGDLTLEQLAAIPPGTQPVEGGATLCLECGRWYGTLNNHLAHRHTMTPAQYRRAHGLPDPIQLQRRAAARAKREHAEARATAKAREIERELAAVAPGVQPVRDRRLQCLECASWYRALPVHLEHHGLTITQYQVRHGLPEGTVRMRVTVGDGPPDVGPGIQPRRAGQLQCLECGRWLSTLPNHLTARHRITSAEYRVRHQLSNMSLDSDDVIAKRAAATRRTWNTGDASAPIRLALREAAARRHIRQRHIDDARAMAAGYSGITEILNQEFGTTKLANVLGITEPAAYALRKRYGYRPPPRPAPKPKAEPAPKPRRARANRIPDPTVQSQCLECTEWFTSVGHHVVRAHGLTVAEYRTKHAISGTLFKKRGGPRSPEVRGQFRASVSVSTDARWQTRFAAAGWETWDDAVAWAKDHNTGWPEIAVRLGVSESTARKRGKAADVTLLPKLSEVGLRMLNAAAAHHATHGTLRGTTGDLADWLSDQRNQYTKGRRSRAFARLYSLDPDWHLRRHERPPLPKKPCSIDDCDQPVLTREMCSVHYWRWYRQKRKQTAATIQASG